MAKEKQSPFQDNGVNLADNLQKAMLAHTYIMGTPQWYSVIITKVDNFCNFMKLSVCLKWLKLWQLDYLSGWQNLYKKESTCTVCS